MAETTQETQKNFNTGESFADLFAQDPINSQKLKGTVVKGSVLGIENDFVLVDVGLKSEGRIPLKEFGLMAKTSELKPGDEVEVYIERMEDREGSICLSREKARREESWVELERAFQTNKQVKGIIFGRVKGGFTVDLDGAIAFLPTSQLDIRPIRDVDSLMHIGQPFQILKMDRSRGNIIVSRRAILEESRVEARNEMLSNLKEGQVLEGVVKNITDYGAFIDLGGADGLLHVTDISWDRIGHPSEKLSVGDNINVMVIRFNSETQRISLGMKQLEEDPWKGIEEKFPVGSKVKGEVTNITEFGAFVKVTEGVEGLVHVSDMSWTRKISHPSQFLAQGQTVECAILSIDTTKHRIALGMKQCAVNPWDALKEKVKIGDVIEGPIKNITEFGLFVGVTEDIDGMVHMSDLSWQESGDQLIKNFKKGDTIKVKILDIDSEKERIILGVKQLEEDPIGNVFGNYKKNDVVTCEIKEIQDSGLLVSLDDKPIGFIRKNELSKDRQDRRTERFAVGERVDAKVLTIDQKTRMIQLSIKAREVDEEKAAMEQYGSTDSGASLGDILGAAMNAARQKKDDSAE